MNLVLKSKLKYGWNVIMAQKKKHIDHVDHCF